jgi:hypothetical protein
MGVGAQHEVVPSPAPAQGETISRMSERFDRASELLESGAASAETRAVQQEIVTSLDSLLDLLGQSGAAATRAMLTEGEPESGTTSGASGRPEVPAEESILPIGDRSPEEPPAGAGEAVGRWLPALPAAEQQVIEDAFSMGRLPWHYREVMRAYSKRLAEDPESEERL